MRSQARVGRRIALISNADTPCVGVGFSRTFRWDLPKGARFSGEGAFTKTNNCYTLCGLRPPLGITCILICIVCLINGCRDRVKRPMNDDSNEAVVKQSRA